MKKFMINFISLTLISIAILLLLLKPNIVFSSVNQALYLWTTRVFPVLFPFIILSQISIDLGLVNIISNIVQPINKLLFRTSKKCGFIFLFSLFSGNPSGAMIIQRMLENNEITKKEAGMLLNYTSFVSPIFAIGTIGYAFFNNITIGYIVLLAHILGNIIIGIIIGIFTRNQTCKKTSCLKDKYNALKTKVSKKSLGEILSDKLQYGINIMFLICGFMIIFTILINYLSSIMDNTNISIPSIKLLLFGALEMVSSVNYIFENISETHLSVAFITSSISFAGLCIHSQVYVFISKANLKYIPFLISRIIHALISGIIAYTLYPIMMKNEVTDTFSKMHEENNTFNNNFIFISIIMIVCYICYEIVVSIKKSDDKFIT